MYYVYELIDPRVNFPFYVGKGKNDRVYFHLSEKSRAKTDNERKFNKIQKIRKEGYEPEIKIVKYFENEDDAYDYEEQLIKKYGRVRYDENGILMNICESSRPPRLKGRTYQEIYGDNWEEQIQKRMKTKEERKNYGGVKKHTEETKKKISERAKERFAEGFKSPSSVTYLLTSPSGEKFEVFGELKKFCRENKISYATMHAAILYDRRGPRKNGWSIEKV